jgi:formimidoylglutamate deiminase
MTGVESRLFAAQALLAEGWADNVLFNFGTDGTILSATPDVTKNGLPTARGPVLPGMLDVHSHAFQRGLAGQTERAGPDNDSFWTWREAMYSFVRRLTPEQVEAIASQLYVELLKQGYTAVGEFHYLHHAPGGGRYDEIAEMSLRVVAAARYAGIAITHLPVLYSYGGFGCLAVGDAQRRFCNTPDALMRIVDAVRTQYREDVGVRVGIAPHSLRAVTSEILSETVSAVHSEDPTAPVHIHIAEQQKEVTDCIAWSGMRPVDWLFAHATPDPRWCLVHATHTNDAEIRRVADSGAIAGLCPTTEANLGDGVFPLPAYIASSGIYAVGSDSNSSTSPVEELRWLEYGQRLRDQKRNVTADANRLSVGANLWIAAAAGGAQALAQPSGKLAAGKRADLIVLDGEHVDLIGRQGDDILDGFLFSGNDCKVRDVMVGGVWRVVDGHHSEEEIVATAYRTSLRELLS